MTHPQGGGGGGWATLHHIYICVYVYIYTAYLQSFNVFWKLNSSETLKPFLLPPYTIVLSRLVCLNSNFLLQPGFIAQLLPHQTKTVGSWKGKSLRIRAFRKIRSTRAASHHTSHHGTWPTSFNGTYMMRVEMHQCTSQKLDRFFKVALHPPEIYFAIYFLKVDVQICQPSTPNGPTVGFSQATIHD